MIDYYVDIYEYAIRMHAELLESVRQIESKAGTILQAAMIVPTLYSIFGINTFLNDFIKYITIIYFLFSSISIVSLLIVFDSKIIKFIRRDTSNAYESLNYPMYVIRNVNENQISKDEFYVKVTADLQVSICSLEKILENKHRDFTRGIRYFVISISMLILLLFFQFL